MRLIDADALIKQIEDNTCKPCRKRKNDYKGIRCKACQYGDEKDDIDSAPPAQHTLYGYNIDHLELIARVLQKEDLPPERVAEAITDIGRIVAIVRDEFEETLRKAVERGAEEMETLYALEFGEADRIIRADGSDQRGVTA